MAPARAAGSNGVSKAPWWCATSSAEATAGAKDPAMRAAARAAAKSASLLTASEQSTVATAARPMTRTAGTSQPGVSASPAASSQAA